MISVSSVRGAGTFVLSMEERVYFVTDYPLGQTVQEGNQRDVLNI